MKNLAYNFKGVPYIHIPTAYPKYCNEKIITMELIKGREVAEVMANDYPQYNEKLIAKRGVKSYFKQIMIDGFFHADPHPGNMMIMDNNVLCYIDEGMMGILDDDFREELAELILLLLSRNIDNIINQLIYMDILTPAQNTPELKADVNDIMNKYYSADLKGGNLSVKLKHESISELTNQLSISLILSALIIGSSLAIMANKGPKLFDIPIVGLIGFVFSAALEIYLVIQFMLKEN